METLTNILGLLPSILSLVMMIASIILSIYAVVKGKSSKEGAVANLASKALKTISKSLPNLIAYTETTNPTLDGAGKKDFLMDMVKTFLSLSGVELSEAELADISKEVDDLVALTKKLHVGGSVTNGSQVHDIGAVTGLSTGA